MMLPFEDVCMPALELKAGKWRRYPWGCFGYLPSFAALFVFGRRTLMASCPWCSTTFRLGEASSCWPRSQRALFRPWSLLPSCHQKKSRHQSPPKSKHGDAGGAGDGAASRGLIYRHCATHKPVITA